MVLEIGFPSRTGTTLRHVRYTVSTLAILVVLLAAPAAVFAADIGHGLEIANKWCNACHSIGTDEPRQEDAGPLWTDLAKKDADYLLTAINRPHDFMPDFPQLSEADKSDLIAYIQSLREG